MTDAMLTRTRLLTAVLLVATFALGTATGAGIYHLASRSRVGERPMRPPPFPPLPLGELGLSAEQHAKIQAIIERRRPEIERVFESTFPRMKAIKAELDKEVRAVLTPAQREKLQKLVSEQRAPDVDSEHRPPPPPPRPWAPGHGPGLGAGPPRPHPGSSPLPPPLPSIDGGSRFGGGVFSPDEGPRPRPPSVGEGEPPVR